MNPYNNLHQEALRRETRQPLAKIVVIAVCVFATGFLIVDITLQLDNDSEPVTGLESGILEVTYE